METLSDRGQGRARGWGRDLNCWAPRTGPGARKTGGCGFNVPAIEVRGGGSLGLSRSRQGRGRYNQCHLLRLPLHLDSGLVWWAVWCGLDWTPVLIRSPWVSRQQAVGGGQLLVPCWPGGSIKRCYPNARQTPQAQLLPPFFV